MQFCVHAEASSAILEINDELYTYLIKARRHKVEEEIYFRNLKDKFLYCYKITQIDKRKALCTLLSSEEKVIENPKNLHIAWCVVDPKTIEKTIASLNELGVGTLTFIYCEYSQKNFKINFEKLEKILMFSSSQCGRSSIMKLQTCKSVEQFLQQYPNTHVLDFSSNRFHTKAHEIETLLIGCEGGFSTKERERFDEKFVVGLESNLILRSETAIVGVAAKLLV